MLVFVGESRFLLGMNDYSVSADLFRDESFVKKHILNNPTYELDHRSAFDLVTTRSYSGS